MADDKKILLADKIAEQFLTALQEQHGAESVTYAPKMTAEELEAAIGAYDVVYVRSTEVTEQAARNAKENTTFVRGGAGTDNLKAAKEAGFIVENTPGANAMGVVDLTFGLMATLLIDDSKLQSPEGRTHEILGKIVEERHLREGVTEDGQPVRNETLAQELLDTLREDRIPELEGKTLLITGGTGAIGQLVTEYAQAMGMDVIAEKARSMDEKFAAERNIRLVDSLEEGLAQADVVSLHSALVGKERDKEAGNTFASIGQGELDMMKPSAVLINTGRAALIAEGVETSIPMAIDDMPDKVEKLGTGIEKLTNSPKRGAKTAESDIRVGEMVVNQISLAMEGKAPINVVTPDEDLSEIDKAKDITPEYKREVK
jgi:D-3-phosphoglycerate dehydrogenase